MPAVGLPFVKVHGLGNDFVLLDLRRGGAPLSKAAVVRVCDRRHGIGADGVLTLLPPSAGVDLDLLIQNADGSVPEMCGNGLRCVVDFVTGGEPGHPVRVGTGAGPLEGRVEPDGRVRVTLGAARVVGDPVSTSVDGVEVDGVAVDVGNPHLVLFLEAVWPERSLVEIADRCGPRLERHPAFPERVNVGFARRDRSGIELAVFERGAGRTEACGTGAAAAARAARHRGLDAEAIRVRLPGGTVEVVRSTSGDDAVELIGPAKQVFSGRIDDAALDVGP